MGRYRKILIAVDGSGSSRNALRQAIALANIERSWMVAVSVIPSYDDLAISGIRHISELFSGPYQRALDEARDMARSEGRFIRTVLEQGTPYQKIVNLAQSESCDLIVTGRKGFTRLERMFMGSVTARIIGYCNTDVLVIPWDAQIGWKKILAPVDGSVYSAKAVATALDFAKSYGGELEVLSVSPTVAVHQDVAAKLHGRAANCTEFVRSEALRQEVNVTATVLQGEPHKLIAGQAKKRESDVIVMGSHGRTGIRRLLMGSVTEKVIGQSHCPVLVVK